jgi:hypothetical protein
VGAAAVVAAGAAAVGAAAVVAVGAAVAAPPQAITANIANKAVSKHNRLINWLSEITIQESSKKNNAVSRIGTPTIGWPEAGGSIYIKLE